VGRGRIIEERDNGDRGREMLQIVLEREKQAQIDFMY